MKYPKVVSAKFIDRPNRFIAHVEVEGRVETVHVKNTGRCKELLVPGCKVILEDCRSNPSRKTGFDLIAVYKCFEDGRVLLINKDSQAPNKVVAEWLKGQGYKCYLAFVIQIPGVTEVQANVETHAEFGVALDEAKAAGVEVLFLCCDVKEDELKIR